MKHERGVRVEEYRAPLFLAWQLTNRCAGTCLHCCEESGPDKGWKDELSREEALDLARQIAEAGVSYVAFGGGEPMTVPHVWEIFEILHKGGVQIKIETDGLSIDASAARRLKALDVACVQISLDGAKAETHERLRPGGSFKNALAALRRLGELGLEPEAVFIPTRLNVQEMPDAYDLFAENGARRFVTGPLMRLGRAAAAWDSLAVPETQWQEALQALKERARKRGDRPQLAIYPWGIQHEMATRAESPQAMMLVVPNGKVKLLNALPFAVTDLKRESLIEAWPKVGRAWRSPEVQDFVRKAQTQPALLAHANECWAL